MASLLSKESKLIDRAPCSKDMTDLNSMASKPLAKAGNNSKPRLKRDHKQRMLQFRAVLIVPKQFRRSNMVLLVAKSTGIFKVVLLVPNSFADPRWYCSTKTNRNLQDGTSSSKTVPKIQDGTSSTKNVQESSRCYF